MDEKKLLHKCPFCGGTAQFERLGTPRQSCIVVCEECGATLESNETGKFCGEQWNRRVIIADDPSYDAGRLEGHADMCAELRRIIDPHDENKWNKKGLLKEVCRLKQLDNQANH